MDDIEKLRVAESFGGDIGNVQIVINNVTNSLGHAMNAIEQHYKIDEESADRKKMRQIYDMLRGEKDYLSGTVTNALNGQKDYLNSVINEE